MRLGCGSVQRKGRRWYYVARIGGRQKWVALKTRNRAEAAARARRIAAASQGEAEWLRHLAALGAEAERELRRLERRAEGKGWEGLWEDFRRAVRGDVPEASERTYRRWLGMLEAAAPGEPEELTARDAEGIAAGLRATHLSAPRIIRFWRRVWRATGLGAEVWEAEARVRGGGASGKAPARYRRLSADEVRAVRGRLLAEGGEAARACADMVAIGWFTGLRLGDVAGLEAGEVEPGGGYLRLVPDKVRTRKSRPILVPLAGEAREIVSARMASAGGDGRLFPPEARVRPSRRITAAFRAAGILNGPGVRASFHSLRATFISHMDEAGVPPHVTDAITGHGGGGMHGRYTQPSAEAMRRAVERAIPPLHGVRCAGGASNQF